jgi:mono/diheme cytochrome c family protein
VKRFSTFEPLAHAALGESMIRVSIFALAVALMCAITIAAADSSHASGVAAAKIARGKYLVDQVGMCGDCHTPRDERGKPVAAKYLQGAPIGFKPIAPVPVWADKAPAIAGLPGWDDAAAIKFMMTGIAYNDLPPRPPMPPYRFNKQDAEAVVAYLKSLAPNGASQRK